MSYRRVSINGMRPPLTVNNMASSRQRFAVWELMHPANVNESTLCDACPGVRQFFAARCQQKSVKSEKGGTSSLLPSSTHQKSFPMKPTTIKISPVSPCSTLYGTANG